LYGAFEDQDFVYMITEYCN